MAKMKLITILFMVFAIQIFECESFNLGNFFSSFQTSTVSSTSNAQTINNSPFNKPFENEQLEAESFSPLEVIEIQKNGTFLSSNENLELQNNTTLNENLTTDNSTSDIFNIFSDITETISSSSAKTENILLQVNSTNAGVTESHTVNATLAFIKNTNSSTEEPEDVVLGTQPSTFTDVTKTIYQKTKEWMADTYTLSILIPVAAGILFAVTIITVIACCRCIRKKCRRRRFRKRVLPDSIKSLRPSDQAKLLGDCCDSSDDEF